MLWKLLLYKTSVSIELIAVLTAVYFVFNEHYKLVGIVTDEEIDVVPLGQYLGGHVGPAVQIYNRQAGWLIGYRGNIFHELA